jgi:hypothetical protein
LAHKERGPGLAASCYLVGNQVALAWDETNPDPCAPLIARNATKYLTPVDYPLSGKISFNNDGFADCSFYREMNVATHGDCGTRKYVLSQNTGQVVYVIDNTGRWAQLKTF